MAARRDGRSGGRKSSVGRSGPKPSRAASSRSGPSRSGTSRSASGRGGPGRSGPGRSGDRPGQRPAKRSGPRGLGGEQIEGRQAVRELLLAQSRPVTEILLADDLEGDPAVADIVELAAAERVAVSYVARRRLESLCRSEAPQGVMATAAPLSDVTLSEVIEQHRTAPLFVVAVDGVTDPGNLGAILRSCEGAGVDAVVIPRHRAVHVTPTVAKAAAGAIEYLPIAMVGGLPAALERLREAGVWIVGFDDGADRTVFEIGDLANEAICVVLGAEGAGLSRLVRERCDVVVQIPMRGRLSSLNVSAAAALATYEVVRHRSAGG
jgi:23S rRNA (guanosine2251-2'-O)-methyltransferase